MKVGVVGAGSWGTALAMAAARAGSKVALWSHNEQVVEDINKNRRNTKYIGNVELNDNITASYDILDAFTSDVVLLVVPAQTLRSVCEDVVVRFAGKYSNSTPLVICAKGVEQGSHALLDSIVAESFPENPIVILSGPNFADEVVHNLPACATVATDDNKVCGKVIAAVGSERFRLYYSNDMIGAQIAGALKNVIAIACGVAIGRGLGENARAALVTRGIAEIGRLSIKMGGKQETLLGLSGIGDIMLSCGSDKSRNMHLGNELGRGKTLEQLLAEGKTVEGVATAKSAAELAQSLGVDMPITNAVKAILYDNASIEETIKQLLDRPVAADGCF